MLDLRTFGGLSVRLRDGRQPAPAALQPRRLAILAVVGRAGARGVTRDKILALLWPDADDEAGRKALNQALYQLRTGLDCEALFLGTQELRLNPEVAGCDVADYEAALAAREWERAAALYEGPFLDGFRVPAAGEFARWADEERADLAHRQEELLERLGRRAAERGDAREAAGWWRRRAAADPLNGRAAIEYMRCLAAAGDVATALRHARIYEALVAQELSMPADREVLALAERLRAESAAAPPPPPAPAPVPAPP
ncbi:BTAD domain-containing putative transcriptional regulator, partial [Roseisolibacter sp. H3M3-2]|uniref:AfsR/SARP family transcriptional regulator n=1 Tax=Roseisolibacter sp. H3M3-2 TaxID=3031323 RepID=UPI0023DB96E2